MFLVTLSLLLGKKYDSRDRTKINQSTQIRSLSKTRLQYISFFLCDTFPISTLFWIRKGVSFFVGITTLKKFFGKNYIRFITYNCVFVPKSTTYNFIYTFRVLYTLYNI